MLPLNLDFESPDNAGGASRKVRKTARLDPDNTQPDEGLGSPNDPKVGTSFEPFHIFLHRQNVTTGFALVRVVNRKDSTFNFKIERDAQDQLIEGGFLGIAGSISNSRQGILCGNRYKDGGNNNSREVARFYIDLNKFWSASGPAEGESVPFNILVLPRKFPETLIIIDPAVRNEG